ncbi:hypothetical protein LguiB_035922 [Lonicera macranthoides]
MLVKLSTRTFSRQDESEFPEGSPTIYLTLRTFVGFGINFQDRKGRSIYLFDPSSRERVLGIDPFVLHREERNRIV